MIEVSHLTKNYGPHKAIDNLTFSVKKGEVVGFLGPNGAGKTTTMKVLTGCMAPSHGSASIGGQDVFVNPLQVKRQVGYLPEVPPLYVSMKVKEYLAYAARLKGVEKKRLGTLVSNAIEKTNLQAVAHRLIQNLSKGFRQRVGIAQALVSDPQVLILDEPTVGLDPKQVAEIRDLIIQLKGEHTIILSTHILPEVEATCEKIIIIHEGKIVAQSNLSNLSSLMGGNVKVHLRVRHFSPELEKGIHQVMGVQSVRVLKDRELEVELKDGEEPLDLLSAFLVNQKAGLLEMRSYKMDLEQVFLKLTYGRNMNSGSSAGSGSGSGSGWGSGSKSNSEPPSSRPVSSSQRATSSDFS